MYTHVSIHHLFILPYWLWNFFKYKKIVPTQLKPFMQPHPALNPALQRF